MPYTLKLSIPKRLCVIRPFGPKENITVMAIVKGGEISGRIIAQSRRRDHHFGRFALTDVKAKKKPRAVPKSPTRAPRRILFQVEISVYLLKRISEKPAKLKCPPSINASAKILIIGSRTKIARKTQITATLSSRAGSLTRFPNVSAFLLLNVMTDILSPINDKN